MLLLFWDSGSAKRILDNRYKLWDDVIALLDLVEGMRFYGWFEAFLEAEILEKNGPFVG